MSARGVVAAAAVAMGLAGSLFYLSARRAPSAVRPPVPRASTSVPRVEIPSPAPPSSGALPALVVPSASRPEPDAEQLLRELEPLSVTDKPRALALALAADERMSSSGVMAEARRALIVTLMVDLDRMPEARARTREMLRLYPNSPYLPLVQGVTGIHPRPHPSD